MRSTAPHKSTLWPALLFAAALTFGPPAQAGTLPHQLAINPPSPSTGTPITVQITGTWPGSAGPAITGWSRDGSVLRVDATGVLPGIPQLLEPYEDGVDVGPLPAGTYSLEYYLTTIAAPRAALKGPFSPQLVATLQFQVVEVIPTLATGALALLAAMLAAAALRILRR